MWSGTRSHICIHSRISTRRRAGYRLCATWVTGICRCLTITPLSRSTPCPKGSGRQTLASWARRTRNSTAPRILRSTSTPSAATIRPATARRRAFSGTVRRSSMISKGCMCSTRRASRGTGSTASTCRSPLSQRRAPNRRFCSRWTGHGRFLTKIFQSQPKALSCATGY